MSGTLGDWPEPLGCPLRASYAGQGDPQYATTEVADGPARHRLITTDERRRWSVEFVWTWEQVQIFEGWVAADLNMGLAWFRMNHLTGGGMTEHFCHFVGDYTIRAAEDSPDYFACAFEVEAFTRWPVEIPPLEFLDPYDAGLVTDPLPADIVNAREANDPRPPDRIDALVPGA